MKKQKTLGDKVIEAARKAEKECLDRIEDERKGVTTEEYNEKKNEDRC
jgi:fructose-1,6-bisphosphatase/inositol monophosphatase family enzyme